VSSTATQEISKAGTSIPRDVSNLLYNLKLRDFRSFIKALIFGIQIWEITHKQSPRPLVREQTMLIEQPPLVDEI
jgi:hypothetical protein